MARVLNRQDMEKIAERVYTAYRRLPEASGEMEELRVDAELLLTKLLGLRIDYKRLSKDGRTLGVTSHGEAWTEYCFEDTMEICHLDGKTVLIETRLRDDPLGRLSFILAHEGAHHILRMLYPRDYGCGMRAHEVLRFRTSREPYEPQDDEEMQANWLASALLMPQELVRQNMKREGLTKPVELLNPIWRPEEFAKFDRMTRNMHVSRKTLAYRMKRLGLVYRVQLDDPNDLSRFL